jgi:hypothetical protein
VNGNGQRPRKASGLDETSTTPFLAATWGPLLFRSSGINKTNTAGLDACVRTVSISSSNTEKAQKPAHSRSQPAAYRGIEQDPTVHVATRGIMTKSISTHIRLRGLQASDGRVDEGGVAVDGKQVSVVCGRNLIKKTWTYVIPHQRRVVQTGRNRADGGQI